MGGICEIATAAPGYSSVLPKNRAPLAMTLKLNGYSTAQFGKCHEVPVWETSPMGPFDQWPTGGGGFEYFYGFIGGETNQWYPAIYEGTTPIEPEKTPEQGYHFTEDMTTKAIKWTRQQKALMPDKPFFLYFAPGACHAPHHVPKEWIDTYKGKFDQGWDKLREEIFARQKKLGVIPADAVLTARPAEIPAWNETPEKMRPIFSREMEVYAGFLEHVDHHLGRLIDALADLEVLDDTLIYYIIGDNGASAEGTPNGCFNEMATLNGLAGLETPEFLASKIDLFGGTEAYNHYAVGWAHAMDTPYQWTKQVASHWGGTRNGTIVHWPNGFKARGEVRSQFHHVIDVAPTILEAAGLPHPTVVNSVQQAPIEGFSMLYAFDDAKAAERHETQYFEMFCNRGIYHKGWTAVTRHGVPWLGAYKRAFDDDVWELYDTNTDWTQSKDLAKTNPKTLAELQRLFIIEASKYSALPLDDRTFERFSPDLAGRPQLIKGKTQILFGGMGRLSENSIVSIKNRSHAITADLDVSKSGAEGVIIAQGGSVNGWSLYAKGGKLKYCYNFFGIEVTFVESTQPIPAGHHQVRMEFKYDGGGVAKGGVVTLYVDGQAVGQGRIEKTVPMAFSADETCDVGKEAGSPVSPDYGPSGNEFSGEVNWVQIDLDKDDHDHMISAEERYKVAMARQ
jgi:arylsulfatase